MTGRRTCPLDGKPLLYAPYVLDGFDKVACSDPECANAHGMVDWGLPE